MSVDLTAPPGRRARVWVRVLIVLLTLSVLAVLYTLQAARDQGAVSPPLAERPKPVTVAPARTGTYRETRTYIGTLRPWVSAEIGPQMTSGYVQSVLVRPGDRVKRGDVLATLDCRDAEASSRAVRLAAKALEAERAALAREAARVSALAEGEFVSRNEVDLKLARTEADRARALAEKSRLLSTSLRVEDCFLRSPVDGEVIERRGDPGAFIRPGDHLLTVMDRAMIRVEAHAPEDEFTAVEPETTVRLRLLATGEELVGRIARRTPAADEHTRTIHFEVDIDNADHSLPVGSTARVEIDVGSEVPVVEVPLTAVSVRAGRATLFVVEGERAARRQLKVLGERGRAIFLEPSIPEGAPVVIEGRALLRDGDLVLPGAPRPESIVLGDLVGDDAALPGASPPETLVVGDRQEADPPIAAEQAPAPAAQPAAGERPG